MDLPFIIYLFILGSLSLSFVGCFKFAGREVPRGSSLSLFSSMPTVGSKQEITYLCPSDKTILSL